MTAASTWPTADVVRELGVSTEPHMSSIDAAGIRAYAAATDDHHAPHAAGAFAPAAFAFVTAFPAVNALLRRMVPDDYWLRSLHGEHDVEVFQPMLPGQVLHTVATPIGVRSSATGCRLYIRVDSVDERGLAVLRQHMTSFSKGDSPEMLVGDVHEYPFADGSGEHTLGRVVRRTTHDQTLRYAEASGDWTRVHVDNSAARAAGLPGIILHGMCTVAEAASAVLEAAHVSDQTYVRRLSVRFAAPVVPGQDIAVEADRSHARGTSGLSFVAHAVGTPVLTRGWMEVGVT